MIDPGAGDMMPTCGSCRFWGKYEGNENETGEAFRSCQAVVHVDRDNTRKGDPKYDSEQRIKERVQIRAVHRAVVVDGSDYFAALKSRTDFGCILHVPADKPHP